MPVYGENFFGEKCFRLTFLKSKAELFNKTSAHLRFACAMWRLCNDVRTFDLSEVYICNDLSLHSIVKPPH